MNYVAVLIRICFLEFVFGPMEHGSILHGVALTCPMEHGSILRGVASLKRCATCAQPDKCGISAVGDPGLASLPDLNVFVL